MQNGLNSTILNSFDQSINLRFRNQSLGNVVSVLATYIFPLAGIALIIYLLYGGYTFLTAGGNPQKIEQGKQILTNALVGFLVMFAAYWVVQVVGIMLGIGAINNTF